MHGLCVRCSFLLWSGRAPVPARGKGNRRGCPYRPLIYFTASVAATYPVIEPRMRPEPLG